MIGKIVLVLLIGLLAWGYQALCPPPPKICGSPGGPPITGTRVRLRDGRYLAYKEHGVPKETASYKIVFVHGFSANRHDGSLATSGLVEKLGIYIVAFDRPGYAESDPDPKRTIKSTALDIEDLADQLELGSKFYVIGFSMGGQAVWGCLKYIPHRLAGAALIAPVINYWWPGFPSNLSAEAYNQQFLQDQWAVRVAHYAPWLVHWWNTQKWFPSSSVISGRPKLSQQDIEIVSKLNDERKMLKALSVQQGEPESLYRDLIIGFGNWEFDPMDIKNPFAEREAVVHLWQGDEDGMVPVLLQRYIAKKLPWVHYHEVPNAGHLFHNVDSARDAILKTLLTGDKRSLQNNL